jgi:thiol-disulfide isomerase/thioredoxin
MHARSANSPVTQRAARVRALSAVVAFALPAVMLAGCSGGGAQAGSGAEVGDTGFVSGDGSLTVLPADQRGAPIELAGELLDGGSLDLADLRGSVVVVNVWGSWCGPCRQEAPELQEAADRLAGDRVRFVGLNTRDQVEPARAFTDRFGIEFPSILDPDGRLQLAFSDTLPPAAIPSTLVLDREGRVAARIIGPLESSAILRGLASEVVDETRDAGAGDEGAKTEGPATATPQAEDASTEDAS